MTKARLLLAAVVLLGLTTLAFWPGLTTPFGHYDDPLYVWDNIPRLSVPGWQGLKLQFDSNRAWSGNFVEYFPLRDAVYWSIFQVWKLNPVPYHLASLFFHLCASLLVWQFLRQLKLPEVAAWLGGLLFALHPVHIESVVWIAGLKDPMFTTFMMLGLCAYASYRERPATWKYVIMLFGLVCGFLVKSILVAMPVIMLAMELLIGQRAAWKEIAARLFGPIVISGIFFAQILGVGKANHILTRPHGGSWGSHFVLAQWAQLKYLKQAFVPTSYRLIYCFEPSSGWNDPRLWLGLAGLSVVAAIIWSWRKDKLKMFFVVLYAAPMAPVSNLVPFPAIMADRYLYAPSIGAVALVALLASKLPLRAQVLLGVATALLLTTATVTRAAVWHDEEVLWEEPDLDPACTVDTSFPAAQSHILRFITTKDRNEGLLALERAMVTPGLSGVSNELLCTTIIGAAREAHELGGADRASNWAKLSTKLCPNYAMAWNAAMVVSLHKRLDLAAGAATKAWRLEKKPETEVLMWLTRLEYGDASAQANVVRLSQQGLPLVCEKIAQFAADAPQLSAALGEAMHHCEPVLAVPPAK